MIEVTPLSRCFLSALICIAYATAVTAQPQGVSQVEKGEGWPSFVNGGVSTSLSRTLPIEWSPGKEAWRLDLTGNGQSSPIAWGDAIYVTTIDGPKKDRCIVTRIHADSGKKEWEYSIESTSPVENSYYVSRAAPTPACDASGVFAFFESGDVVALTSDGKEQWKRSLTQDYGAFKNEFGLASSVAQSEKGIFILIDHPGESYLVALDKKTGRPLWKSERGERGQSYSSPVYWKVGDREQVVVSSAGTIDGYDTESGKLLWSFTEIGGNTGATPILHSNGRFLISSRMGAGTGGGRGGQRSGERAASGERPTTGERPATTNQSGAQNPAPALQPENTNAAKSNLMAKFDPLDPVHPMKIEWISTKVKGSLCSPILHQGFAYFLSTPGVLYCVDAATGELCYEKRLPCGACWASPIVTENRIYFFGNRGSATVLEVGREYKELSANNRLWEATENENPMAGREGSTHYATIAIRDSLIMRTGETVYCFRNP